MISKELNIIGIKHKDAKTSLIHVEKELSEAKDQLRVISCELETRTKENDHLVSLLED